jgi:hypothetical protein
MADVKFVFIAATVITIFAAGAILMGLISAGSRSISPEVSNAAASYATTFLGMTLFLVILSALVVVIVGSKRRPF